MLVCEWVPAWAAIARGRSADTIDHNVAMVASFVARFHDRDLASLTVFELRRWASEHPGAVRYVKTLLADAVDDGLIESSPAASLKVDRGRPRGRKDVPTAEHVDALRDTAIGLMTETAVGTGLRMSEQFGLATQDGLSAARTGRLTVIGKGGRERTVLVQPRAQTALAAAAALGGDRPLLFANAYGRPWNRSAWGKVTRPIWLDLGVPGSWHGLRHRHATELLDRGASSLDVAVQLGHFDRDGRPDPRLVERVYGHPDHSAALDRLAGLA